jgi:DNA polymerase III psi subunit
MTISKRQFELLQAMNIPLWVSKQSAPVAIVKATKKLEVTSVESSIIEPLIGSVHSPLINNEGINLAALVKNPLFNDLLLTMGLSSADAALANKAQISGLIIGVIHWQFSDNKAVTFSNNCLTTPSMEQLAQSPELKRQLWQLMISNALICQ